MSKIYGYARISTKQQSIERQIRNIKSYNESAIILEEAYTGTKVEGRKEFMKLVGKWVDTDKLDKEGNIIRVLKGGKVKEGDTIVFDSVSRMSRNAEEGIKLYMELFDKGVNLVFLKERHIDTDTYKGALGNAIQLTGTDVDDILVGVNKYMRKLATNQIRLAFEQSEKEVVDLKQRTVEGIETARLNGKQIGGVRGKKLTTKKSILAKEQIKKLSKDFLGSNTDVEVMRIIGIARNSYYKYKKELVAELQAEQLEVNK